MPYELRLPARFANAGWKIKIRDKERLEPPHVTIINGTRAWRWSLRNEKFMDNDPPKMDIPSGVLNILLQDVEALRREWDRMYPLNPVGEIDG